MNNSMINSSNIINSPQAKYKLDFNVLIKLILEFLILIVVYLLIAKNISNSAIYMFIILSLYFYNNLWKINIFICAVVPLIRFLPQLEFGWIGLDFIRLLLILVFFNILNKKKMDKIEVSLILIPFFFLPSLLLGVLNSPSISLPFIQYSSILYFLYFFTGKYSQNKNNIGLLTAIFVISIIIATLIGIVYEGLGYFYNTALATYYAFIITIIIRKIFNSRDILLKYLLISILIIILFLFLYGGARSAFLTVSFATIISILIYAQKNYFGIIIGVFPVIIISIFLVPSSYFVRFNSLQSAFSINDFNYFINYGYGFVGGTEGWRFVGMIDGLKDFLNHPIFGIGSGVPVHSVFLSHWLNDPLDPYSYLSPLNIHLTFLAYLVMGGLVGYSGIILFVIKIIKKFRLIKNFQSFFSYKKLFTPFFLACLFGGFFQPLIIDTHGALFFTMLGTLYYSVQEN